MHFLKEIREHLKDFETDVSDEMHKFIDFLHTKYQEPGPAIVPPPAPIGDPVPALDAAPAPVVEEASASVVEEAPAPVVEEAPAPVAEETTTTTPAAQ
jgi:hypothetical protein